ncbi:hypothetical protein E5329_07975 [Petralouisia muris]|uniref:Uncharacterized protein n=1 Tax=Petralouisia muris TaxID=3032872 RepID=A0AC61RYD9_9FIRM|nr:hypothetical protein [Petralouisia muris]TGY96699.1 hypothetical protein E5329_07975 [Petralouisia muris]
MARFGYYEVAIAISGAQAMTSIGKQRPDLIEEMKRQENKVKCFFQTRTHCEFRQKKQARSR